MIIDRWTKRYWIKSSKIIWFFSCTGVKLREIFFLSMSWQLTKFLWFQTEIKRDKYFVSMSLIFHNFYFYYMWLFLQKKKTFWKWTFSNHHSLSSFWISSVKFGCKCWMFFSQSPFIRKSFRMMIYAVCHKAFNKIDFSVWSAGDENFFNYSEMLLKSLRIQRMCDFFVFFSGLMPYIFWLLNLF